MIKPALISLFLLCCPLIGMSETQDAFQIGSAEHPTIDGHWMDKAAHQENDVIEAKMETSAASRLLPIPFPSMHHEPSDHDWSESHVAAVLEKAAEGGKLSYVLNAAKHYHLPASVALIPIIESRYQPHAVSNKGAVGLWQLSEAVSQDFDLPPSARTDWRASTIVALQHLANLQSHYDNWELTWAAYNAGQGRVDAAIRDNPRANSTEELTLPHETKDYVRQLLSLQSTLNHMDVTHA